MRSRGSWTRGVSGRTRGGVKGRTRGHLGVKECLGVLREVLGVEGTRESRGTRGSRGKRNTIHWKAKTILTLKDQSDPIELMIL